MPTASTYPFVLLPVPPPIRQPQQRTRRFIMSDRHISFCDRLQQLSDSGSCPHSYLRGEWCKTHKLPVKSALYRFDTTSTSSPLPNTSTRICTAPQSMLLVAPLYASSYLPADSQWMVSERMPWRRIPACHNLLLVVHASFPNCHYWSHSFFRCKFSVMPRCLLPSCEVAPLWPIK